MLMSRFAVWIFSISVMVLGAGFASAQDFPNKSIRIVTSEVGGGSDLAARIIAQGISAPLGQPVIVENRGGIIITSAMIVAKSRPDGYSLYYNGANVWLLPFMQDDVPYDPVKDFSPISLTVRAPVVLVVHPSFQANSVKELIALAKSKPGQLNYASGVSGSSGHLAMEFFKVRAGVNIVRIAYSGTAPALNAVIAGEAPVQFASGGSAVPQVKSGRLRALAVASAEPSELLPGLPTVAASGLPGFSIDQRQGIWAPAKTPTLVINRLNQEIVRVLNRAEVKERFRNSGTEVVASSPQEFAAAIKYDMDGLGKVIKSLGIHGE